MFFFEKKNQKTFPGCFARSSSTEPILQRRRHPNARMPAALGATRAKHVVAKPRSAQGKVFCFFFSKKKRFLPFEAF
jgi:hypothetical protein